MKKETADIKGLLKKRIKDLTPSEIRALEKPLGTSSRPFPMYGPIEVDDNGKRVLEQQLSVIADDTRPMTVLSERPYHEVISMMYCDMPVPSMLPMLYDSLERRKIDAKNRTIFMKGDPGHGKSFMAALAGRARTTEGVEIIDCGGKNINELLFEMVLDFGRSAALPDAIDKLIEDGKIHKISLGLLKQLPEHMWSVEDGKMKIDWEGVRIGELSESDKDAGTSAKAASQSDNVQKAYAILMQVAEVEGLTTASGNTLGMNTQLGALPRAFMEGREIVLDEYNKSKEGSDDKMQMVLQFLIGEVDECTVDNPLKSKNGDSGPGSFTFKREDMKAGFFVTFTGNNKEDGKTTRKLNKSVISRLEPRILPEPDKADWQHRMCQIMTGLPVSTLYRTFQKSADANPEAFGDFLVYLRTTKAQVEGKRISDLEETLLRNWQSVNQATDSLAEFYYKWRGMTNIDNIAGKFPQLMAEIDEDYEDKYVVDFRRLIKDVREAVALRPAAKPLEIMGDIDFKGWDKAPAREVLPDEDVAIAYGTRLVNIITRKVFEESKNIGKNTLFKELEKVMQDTGLRDIHLQEGARSARKSVEELLNISSFTDKSPAAQAALAQRLYCDYLRDRQPDLADVANDDIVSSSRMRSIIDALRDEPLKSGEFLFPNLDPETLDDTPFVRAYIFDNYQYQIERGEALDQLVDAECEKRKEDVEKFVNDNLTVAEKNGADDALKARRATLVEEFKDALREELQDKVPDAEMPAIDDLMSHDDLMASIAMPVIGQNNLKAMWNDALSRLLARAEKTETIPQSDDIKIAEGRAESGLATTSVCVSADQGNYPVYVHIVANQNNGKALIVGEAIPARLQTVFREAGMTYVDKTKPNAREQVDMALKDIVHSTYDATKDAMVRLNEAFCYQNDAPEDVSSDVRDTWTAKSLAEKIIDPQTEAKAGRMILRHKVA